MSKVLVLYCSTYGHIETMAQAMAEGARSTGATVDVKRVPETVPDETAKSAHFKLEQAASIATIAELPHYDAIIVGGSPYGATTIAGSQGQRAPSAIDLEGARHQGRLVAQTANKLFDR